MQQSIGKYRVLQLLAEGATSSVFLCRDDFADRECAVKLIHLDRFRGETAQLYRKLLLTEALLLRRLQHPHIVQIFDAAIDEKIAYIAMEYVAGGTLEAHCRPDTLLDHGAVVQIAFKCSRALAFAHSIGVTHRDIKPANILLVSATDIKISDFGSAFHVAATSTVITGLGSPAYMSPEQVRDEPLTLQTDIYSLGVVMYQMLTGVLPFQAGNSYGLMYQITHGQAVPIESHGHAIPPGMARIVNRSIERDRARRYQNWDEVSRDLAEFYDSMNPAADGPIADSAKFDTLRSLDFFAAFSDAELWEVLHLSIWQDIEPGRQLMHDGEEGDFFCVVATGEVVVSKRGRILNVLDSGECFGEMAYLSPEGNWRSADVQTLTATRIITFHTPGLRKASAACQHRFDRAFLSILVRRLAMANDQLAPE